MGIDLSIVVVSSNKDLVLRCFRTLVGAISGISSEIILIDNASQEKIGEIVKKSFPHIKVIRRERNGGFGENNNLGMRMTMGRYVLLLNDDTEIVDKEVLNGMIGWMDKHPKVGLAGCGLLNPDRKTYQGSGGYFPTLLKVFTWMTFIDDIPGFDTLIKPYHPLHGWSFYKGESYFKNPHRQDWITGAFFLMRREAMKEAGFFDENFFLYVEEVELSYRFVKAGWEVWYLPKWKVVHYGQVTTGSENAALFELRNLQLFYKKHYPEWQLPLLTVILKLGVVLRIILYGLIKPNRAKVYVKAYASI